MAVVIIFSLHHYMCSATSRQQRREWSVLGQVDCFCQWLPVGAVLCLSSSSTSIVASKQWRVLTVLLVCWPVGRPYTSWMATLKNDLARNNLTLEDAIELALNKPLWWLLAASGAMHWWCMPNNDDDVLIAGQALSLTVMLLI